MDDKIGRQHLAKALVKAVPVIGDVVNEMVFERAKDEASAADKAKLYATLDSIKNSQGTANTDLGDVLNQLSAQMSGVTAIREAIEQLSQFVQGNADTKTQELVAVATARTMPTYDLSTSDSPLPNFDFRFSLSAALEKELTRDNLNLILGDIPGASDEISGTLPKTQQINALLNWAVGMSGCGLPAVYKYIYRRYPTFVLHP